MSAFCIVIRALTTVGKLAILQLFMSNDVEGERRSCSLSSSISSADSLQWENVCFNLASLHKRAVQSEGMFDTKTAQLVLCDGLRLQHIEFCTGQLSGTMVRPISSFRLLLFKSSSYENPLSIYVLALTHCYSYTNHSY